MVAGGVKTVPTCSAKRNNKNRKSRFACNKHAPIAHHPSPIQPLPQVSMGLCRHGAPFQTPLEGSALSNMGLVDGMAVALVFSGLTSTSEDQTPEARSKP